MDFGQPNSEPEDYIDPEEPPDDHLTRPDMEYLDNDNEVKVNDDHNESYDHLTFDQPEINISSDTNIQSYDDHLTTEFDVVGEFDEHNTLDDENNQEDSDLPNNLIHQNDRADELEVEDRIVRYAMHQWHEET
ncbi:uncharacterized protein LOC123038079 [Drosophila rhopaloa]|uniref:Uncharacterized protein n=1 Tax=Drosophila rhopaloa TaxID=1041015 RepID=A0ABM5JFG8_DRORH|nr:uncharacterized protein LOC123038079 [Drosophila rhopaloa]